jgi:hypothetical protein
MGIIIYLENQNIFMPLGVKVHMGHLGNWLEVRREKIKHTSSNWNPYRLTLNNGLSTGTLHFKNNKLLMTHTPSIAAANTFGLTTKTPLNMRLNNKFDFYKGDTNSSISRVMGSSIIAPSFNSSPAKSPTKFRYSLLDNDERKKQLHK